MKVDLRIAATAFVPRQEITPRELGVAPLRSVHQRPKQGISIANVHRTRAYVRLYLRSQRACQYLHASCGNGKELTRA